MTPERWRRTEELYEGARTLPKAAQAAFLAQACADDSALRREVQALLDEPEHASSFLEQPAVMRGAHLVSDWSAVLGVRETAGRYQLEALLGAGGMGEVYRARDPNLGRDVAIKVLPAAFTGDPDRLARFEREARLLAALNHPGICGIHGIEDADGIRLLVLEFIEGDTLAEWLVARSRSGHSGLALEEALPIARQIADALEAAHDKGIIHRDLKPANIKITSDGVVKILDFGLAKAVDGDGLAPDLTFAPGPSGTVGRHGAVIGTAAYMSPEQARGMTTDRRTDIWAFACVLYEMLTGRVAFAGETVSDSIAKVLEREPDWLALPITTPASIRRLLVRSLAKDPKKRLRAIGDVRLELDAVDEVLPATGETAASRPARSGRAWLWAAAVLVGVGLIAAVWSYRALPPGIVTKFVHTLPAGQTLNGSRGAHIVAISPDGSQFAYSGAPFGLYLRSLSDLDASLVPGTESYEVAEPTFSPDGQSIVFFAIADQTLKRIAVTGGPTQTLCPARSTFGIQWSAGGLVFGQGAGGIKRVSSEGGTPEDLVLVNEGELAHGPQLLPDGVHLLYTLAKGTSPGRWDNAQIVVQSLTTGEKKLLIDGGSDARYLPTGHLIYAYGGSLYAVALDLGSLAVIGNRVRVLEGVRRASGNATGAAVFNVSANGTLLYVSGPAGGEWSGPVDLVLMAPEGDVKSLNVPSGPYALPAVSPDGSRVAFESDDGKRAEIYTYDLSENTLIRPLTSEGNSRAPIWIANDKIAFQSDRGGALGIWSQTLDGAAERLTTPEPGTSHAPESWFGGTLLYSVTKGRDVTLWTYSRDHGTLRVDAAPSTAPTGAVFSPDGQLIAYASTQGTQTTLQIQRFPTGGRIPLTATPSDTPKHPRFSRDGKQLCFDPNLSAFRCLGVTTSPVAFGRVVEIPKKLKLGPPGTRTNYDLTPDGRFVGFVTAGQKEFIRGSNNQVQVVLNWFEELKSQVASVR